MLRIHQPALNPLGFLLPIRRHRNVIVRLHTRIDAEGTLERIQRSEQGNAAAQPPKRATENHLSSCPEDSIDFTTSTYRERINHAQTVNKPRYFLLSVA